MLAGGIELDVLVALAGIAMVAGFLDAIAGGGGLITLPALFIAGIDPVTAIATNKLQAASATVSATVAFARKGMIEWKKGYPIAIMAFVGGMTGALCVSIIPNDTLKSIVPFLLMLVAIYFTFSPKLSNEHTNAKISSFTFALLVAPLIGFYDGVFGPGVGSFFMASFVILLGYGITKAMSYTKLANASCNIGSLTIFALNGSIILPIAFSMAIGAFIGAQLGARSAIKFGARLIKPILITISCLMALKLLLDPENPLRNIVSASL